MSRAFSVDIMGPSGMFVLKSDCQPPVPSENESGSISTDYVHRGLRDIQQIVTILHRHAMEVAVEDDDWDEEDYEADDFEADYAL